MLALERLSPLERAAFLLHDVFGLEFEEVAAAIQRDEATCRQLAHRARIHVRADKPRFKVGRQQSLALAEAFFAASRSGDAHRLKGLLAAEVSLNTDGGGKRPALVKPAIGLDVVVGILERLAKIARSSDGWAFSRTDYPASFPWKRMAKYRRRRCRSTMARSSASTWSATPASLSTCIDAFPLRQSADARGLFWSQRGAALGEI